MSKLVEYTLKLKDQLSSPLSKAGSNVEGFEKKINRTNKTATKSTGGLGSMVGLMGKAFAGFAIAAGIKKLATMGMEMEQTRVRYETFFGSVDAGNAKIEEMKNWSMVTPFTEAQAIKAGASMKAMGVDNDKLSEKMSTLGNISSATGKDFNELTTIYGKAKMAGTIYAEDINQLVEAGVPIVDNLSDALGVPPSQVKKLASEGKISFDILDKSLEAIGGKTGKWGDLMDKQSKTFGGRLSTLSGLSSALGVGLGEMMLPFLGKLVDAGITLVTFIKTNSEAIGNMFRPLMTAFKPIQVAFNSVIEKIGLTSDSGSFLESVFSRIGSVIEFVSPFIAGLAEVVGFVIVKISEVVSVIANWIEKTEWVQKAIKLFSAVIKNTFIELVSNAKQILGGLGDFIIGIFTLDTDKIKEGFLSMWDGVTTTPEEAGDFVQKVKLDYEEPESESISEFEKIRRRDEGRNAFAENYDGIKKDDKSNDLSKISALDTAKNLDISKQNESKEADNKLGSAIGSVSGSKSIVNNITINKLIETYTNHFTNISEAKEDIEKMIKETLLSAVSDVSMNLNT